MLLKKKDEHKRLPPGPKKLPIIGNIHQISQPLHQTLRHLSKKQGPLMFLQLGSVPTLVVSSAAMAKEVLKTHDLIFASRPSLYAAKKLSYNGTDISLAPYGKYWREVRKIAVLELLSTKTVESFESIRGDEVEKDRLIKSIANSTPNKKGNYGEEKAKKGINDDFSEIIKETMELVSMGSIAELFPWMAWYNKLNGVEARLEKNFRALDSFYDMNDPNQEIRLTDDNIKGVLTDMFLAGTDSSSLTLVWTMTKLMKNPTAMRKAQEEVRGVVKEKGAQVKESHLPQLAYLKMILKERSSNQSDSLILILISAPRINFAMVIIELALANLLHAFDWSLLDGARAKDIDMEESFGINVHKKIPLYLVASTPFVAI
ncbi:hypothetical protein AgCh_031719 [Apium graveolens]